MLWAQADDLTVWLEQLWHHWNAAGETLIHPIGTKADIKNWRAAGVSDIVAERRDFLVLYQDHIMRLQKDYPKFDSETAKDGYPSETEYYAVMNNLRAHAKLLKEVADHVWESGKAMDL